MPNYHLSVKVISRSNNRSAVASAAYRSGTKLEDERQQITHDYTRKGGVVHSEIMLPDHAPERWINRETLWNEVETTERATNSRLARELEFSLPRELSREANIELAREMAQSLVDEGMCVDLAIHDKDDGNIHAHLMTPLRSCDENGFLAKSYGVYLVRNDDYNMAAHQKEELINTRQIDPTIDIGENNDVYMTPEIFKIYKQFGWEKVYSYNKGQDLLTKPEAQRQGYDPIHDRDRNQPLQRKRTYNDWDNHDKLVEWRQRWQDIQNETLKEYYQQEQIPEQEREYVDSRSYAEQGIADIPQYHEGVRIHHIEKAEQQRCERLGIPYSPVTDIRATNMEIQQVNAAIKQVEIQYQELQQEMYEQHQQAERDRASELGGRISHANSQLEQVADIRERTVQSIGHLEERINETRSESDERASELNQQKDDTVQRIGQLERGISETRGRIEQVRERITEQRQEINNQNPSIGREFLQLAKQEIEQASSSTGSYEEQQQRERTRTAELDGRIDDLRGRVSEIKEERVRVDGNISERTQEIKNTQEQTAKVDGRREQLRERYNQLTEIRGQLRTRIRDSFNRIRDAFSLKRVHEIIKNIDSEQLKACGQNLENRIRGIAQVSKNEHQPRNLAQVQEWARGLQEHQQERYEPQFERDDYDYLER